MPFAKIPVTKMKGFLEGHTSSPGMVPTAAYSAGLKDTTALTNSKEI